MDPNIPEIVAEFAFVGVATLAAAERHRRRHPCVHPTHAPQGCATRPASRYDDEDRLARIEQAVDAIAIEVERIAEGQRFLTKLQTERTDDRVLKS